MLHRVCILAVSFLLSCKTTTYFVVRHAEKEVANTMTSDVPLSEAGKRRAEALKNELYKEHVRGIYSTNYLRTKATVQPLAFATGIPITMYDPRDSGFIDRLRRLKGNILIVGHSNTVDDLVNRLTGKTNIPGDLPDSQYGDLFIVKKKGNKYRFEKKHFGE